MNQSIYFVSPATVNFKLSQYLFLLVTFCGKLAEISFFLNDLKFAYREK